MSTQRLLAIESPSPWNDAHWVKARHHVKRSPCCKDAIAMGLADGVVVGACWKCNRYVVRMKGGEEQVPA